MATVFTPELKNCLDQAVRYAEEHDHEFVSLEHVMWALAGDNEVIDIIEGCGGSVEKLRRKLEDFMEKQCPKMRFDVEDNPGRENWKPEVTLAFHRVIQRAVMQVYSAEREAVTISSLLIALFPEKESHAIHFLEEQGITRFEVINYVSHGAGVEPGGVSSESEDGDDAGEGKESKGSPLENFTVNLTERAKQGLIEPIIGREDIINRVVQILCRKTKNNPLLVGDPGVGKTAIADGLALLVASGKLPRQLSDTQIFSLDMGSLLAGTKYRGEFEKRMKSVVKALEKVPNAILYVDEIHTLIGAGATSGGSLDASNLLKPALANRTLTCMGSTTHKDYHSYLEKDRAFVRRFQRIDIKEPSTEEAVEILEGIKPNFEKFHNVTYSAESLRAAVELSVKYLHDRPLPDKAIDVIDEAAARLRIQKGDNAKYEVDVEQIEFVVSTMAKVPAKSVSASDKAQLKDLEGDLRKVIFGQDEAISSLVTSIKFARSGLREPNKPIGCYLFTGPTGVGKTEVCKQLSRILGVELTRFDMSEYMEKHSVSRLVGSPPGYVGYDEGGLLTEAVARNPYTVLLLDEMEKAHPDIANVLLQIMDSGRLTDSTGKVVDFRNVILVMTSNAGAREVSRQGIGIKPAEGKARSLEAVKKMFSPEFVNRLDAVVSFSGLNEEVLLKVVDKFLKLLKEQLEERKVAIDFDEAAKKWILQKGYDPAYGARQLSRTIDEYVKKPLVDEVLFGKLVDGGKVSIGVKKDALTFQIA